MIFKIIILAALIKVLLTSNNPLLCAGIYTAVVFFMGIISGSALMSLLIGCIIAFALSLLYYWLLDRFEDQGFIWWVILLGGIFIGVV